MEQGVSMETNERTIEQPCQVCGEATDYSDNGMFIPDKTICLEGGNFDCLDDSDTCATCGEQL